MPTIHGPEVAWRGALTTTSATDVALALGVETTPEARAVHLEQVVGENNLRPVYFLREGTRLASAVAQVIVPGVGLGTGFLVGPRVLMTNNHVLRSASSASDAVARFNFEEDIDGNLRPVDDYRCRPDLLFATNSRLDYTIVALDGRPGDQYGVVTIDEEATLHVGDGVNIVQHPDGRPKEVALVDNVVAYIGDDVVQYLTDTMPGSSGSPVFDDEWNIVALHHSGGWIPEPSASSTHFRNEGIRISSILEDLTKAGVL